MRSNCLIVALLFWIKFPKRVKVKVRWDHKFELPHFYWFDSEKQKHYHFEAMNKNLPNYRLIYFEGRVERFYFYGITGERNTNAPS